MCESYYLCEDNKRTRQECPEGLYFDIFRQDCYYPDAVVCETRCPAEGIVTISHEG